MVTADLIDSQKWEEITKLCRKSHDIVEATRLGAAIKETPSAPLSTNTTIVPGRVCRKIYQYGKAFVM